MKNTLCSFMLLFVGLFPRATLFSQRAVRADSVLVRELGKILPDSSIAQIEKQKKSPQPKKQLANTSSSLKSVKKPSNLKTKTDPKTAPRRHGLSIQKKHLPASRCPCRVLVVIDQVTYEGKALKKGDIIHDPKRISFGSEKAYIQIIDNMKGTYYVDTMKIESLIGRLELQSTKIQPPKPSSNINLNEKH